MGEYGPEHVAAAAVAGLGLGLAAAWALGARRKPVFSIADQVKRFEHAKRTGNLRVLNIDKFFQSEKLKGKRVLVLGASRGLGMCLVEELVLAGAKTIATTRRPNAELNKMACEVIEGVDSTTEAGVSTLVDGLDAPIDAVILNAGYFYGPVEKIDSLNFEEEWKMINVCALGSLRASAALVNAGKIRPGGKIIQITSQAGSIAWREVQNPDGDNYGHHMSRAATNIMARLLSFEMREHDIAVGLFHPGFNRTDMTKKYEHIWDKEGAVDPSVGARRVLHEMNELTLETSGTFINCEDGLQIPW